MKTRKPLPRRQAPLKRTPVKKVNRARKAKNHARAYGGKARIEWLKSLPRCTLCFGPKYGVRRSNKYCNECEAI